MTTPPGSRLLEVGYSPCPNDTFIFHGLVSGLVQAPGLAWKPVLEDVETLNLWAFERRLPVTKISFHAYGALRETHALLRTGAALGRGCGPLVVARRDAPLERLPRSRVAIPGRWTSAALLLRLYCPELGPENLVQMPFHRILGAVASGEVEAGLIIHESRFTYERHGLVALVDLGTWWEETSGHPIPLGGIIADRGLGDETILAIEHALGQSVRLARRRPELSAEYVGTHAQEIEPEVQRAHIDLYVNDFTEDLGVPGLEALRGLYDRAVSKGILPAFRGEMTIPRRG